MAEKIYVGGFRTFEKHEKAPDFVLGTLIIDVKEFNEFVQANPTLLQDYNGKKQLRTQVTRNDAGRLVIKVDTYTKQQ